MDTQDTPPPASQTAPKLSAIMRGVAGEGGLAWDALITATALGVLGNQQIVHPITRTRGSVFRVIMSLQEGYGWTRARIAAWLETEGL